MGRDAYIAIEYMKYASPQTQSSSVRDIQYLRVTDLAGEYCLDNLTLKSALRWHPFYTSNPKSIFNTRSEMAPSLCCFTIKKVERDYAVIDAFIEGFFNGRCDPYRSNPSKGFPDIVSYAVSQSVGLVILQDKEYTRLKAEKRNLENYASESQAAVDVLAGDCSFFTVALSEAKFISDPDKSPGTWLTIEEFEKTLDYLRRTLFEHRIHPDYYGLLASMKRLEEHPLVYNVRAVVWPAY